MTDQTIGLIAVGGVLLLAAGIYNLRRAAVCSVLAALTVAVAANGRADAKSVPGLTIIAALVAMLATFAGERA